MKVLIVGAGPIGSYTARLLTEKDDSVEVKLIEEHEELGRPMHCAGLVSRHVFDDALIPLDKTTIINHIDGAEIFFNGDSFQIRRKDVAVVIDRERFDRSLGSGLDISFDTRFIGAEKEKNGYLVETDKGEYHTDILIGADGANSTVRRIDGIKESIEYLRGTQFRVRYKTKKNFVQVYLKKPFFAWIIPESSDIIRAGIISANPYHDLLDFLKGLNIKGEILDKFAGLVPLGACSTQLDNIFLVGDAACQIKPITQGGIYYGMRCAEILADCILKRRPHDYERKWQDRFNREIQVGLKIRKLYESLSNDNMANIFGLLKKNRLILEKFGDFENHSRVVSALVRSSPLKNFLVKILLGIIKDIRL